MKAELETFSGILVESETDEEAERLTYLYQGKARVAMWERTNGKIKLIFAPSSGDNGDENSFK